MRSDHTSNELPPIRVLLVDDDPAQRWLTSRWLEEQAELVFTVAATGHEALERAWEDRPDVILLDLILPGIDGMEVLRRYRAGGGSARIIVISRAVSERVSSLAFSLGADYFIPKPFDYAQLLPHIRVLGGGLDRQYAQALLRMGASPRWKGFHQAARCAALLSQDREELLKSVYIQTARELKAEPEQVEINIRRLVQDLHRSKFPFYRQAVPGAEGEKPPSNKEFLAILIAAARIPL